MAEHRPGARRVSRRAASREQHDGQHLELVAPADGTDLACAEGTADFDHLDHLASRVHDYNVDDAAPVDNVTFALDYLSAIEQHYAAEYRAVHDEYRAALRGCLLGQLLRAVGSVAVHVGAVARPRRRT